MDVKAPAPGESLVDVMGTPGPDGQIVDAHPADNSTVPGGSVEGEDGRPLLNFRIQRECRRLPGSHTKSTR